MRKPPGSLLRRLERTRKEYIIAGAFLFAAANFCLFMYASEDMRQRLDDRSRRIKREVESDLSDSQERRQRLYAERLAQLKDAKRRLEEERAGAAE